MIEALGRFVEALRKEGLPVSPAEVLDAVRAVEAVGVDDRARFRAALRVTMAKGTRPSRIFDDVFQRFFAAPKRTRTGRGKERAAGGLGVGGTGGTQGAEGRPGRDRAPLMDRASRRASPDRQRRRRGRDAVGEGEERVREALEALRLGRPRRSGRLRAARLDGKSGRERSRHQDPAETADPLHRELHRPLAATEERRLAEEVPRLVEAIRLRAGRRLRCASRGRLWTRRLFRDSLRSGGVPFVLPFRKRRPRRPRVVLLVDVSYSVARAAGYFLWMAAQFVRLGRQTRVIAFVDRPVDATPALARWMGRSRRSDVPADGSGSSRGRGGRRGRHPGEGIVLGGVSFADLLDGLPGLNLSAPSDYGRVLHALLHSHLRPAGRDTILVVLGDARTNRFEALPWALDEIAGRCRGVIWLVPEPRARWGAGDSALGDYLEHVDVLVEAADLAGLARGVGELVKRI